MGPAPTAALRLEQERAETRAFSKQLLWGLGLAHLALGLFVLPLVAVMAVTEVAGVDSSWWVLQALGTIFVGLVGCGLAVPGFMLLAHEGYPRWVGAAASLAVVSTELWLIWEIWTLDLSTANFFLLSGAGCLCFYLMLASTTLLGARPGDGRTIRTATTIVLASIAVLWAGTEVLIGLMWLSPEEVSTAVTLDPAAPVEPANDEDGLFGVLAGALTTVAVCGAVVVPIMRLSERARRHRAASRAVQLPPPPPQPPWLQPPPGGFS